jgi:tetratricopeptide (TPR) repeat protein
VTELAAHQVAALNELMGWWDDLHDCATGSQLARFVVPPGWGRTVVLDALEARVAADERLGIVVRLSGKQAPDDLPLQVTWLEHLLRDKAVLAENRRALKLDRVEGVAEAGLGALGLAGLVTGLPQLVTGLPASLLLELASSARDRTRAGQLADVARMAHAMASYSISLPVAVLVDDAELLDPDLVGRLAFTLLDRTRSNALVVVTAAPEAALLRRFSPSEPYGPRWERIGSVDVDPSMEESARRRLIEAATDGWPAVAVDRLVVRTRTFADIWGVLSLPAAADVLQLTDGEQQVRLVDNLASQVIDARRPPPSAQALAWAGGLMHDMQLDAAVAALQAAGEPSDDDEARSSWVAQFGHAVRFADPGCRLPAERSASVLSHSQRVAMAAAVRAVARQLYERRTPGMSHLDLISALRPVHHLVKQGELDTDVDVGELLILLATEMESIGDPFGALRVAETTLDLVDQGDPSGNVQRDQLRALVLRLAHVCGDTPVAERVTELAEMLEEGAIIGLEARLWVAITLLDRPGTRPAGARMADTLADELTASQQRLGMAGRQWSLILAFHTGRAGYVTLAEDLLAPLLESPDEPAGIRDGAYQVLTAVGGAGGADLRLFRQALLGRYQQLEEECDLAERLVVVSALAYVAGRLGSYAQARRFASEELAIRLKLFHPDHPDTLTARGNVAFWTGQAGDANKALELLEALLPDTERVFGPDHPHTLTDRSNIVAWTGKAGDAKRALTLSTNLLPDLERVLGPDYPETLIMRGLKAKWTAESGDAKKALGLFEALLPDMERVLGSDHPQTLVARVSRAAWTGQTGNPKNALELSDGLLPDMARVLGPDHPDTLITRSNVASWTAEIGKLREGLALFEALLPDRIRALGADHPDTLITRSNVASWAGEVGDKSRALALFEALLPDMERVLGTDHPATLVARGNLATWTLEAGDARKALALFEALLTDQGRVLGPNHPNTLRTRSIIESLRRI